MIINENVNPGIHPNADEVIQNVFPESERRVATYWSREWYITHAGKCDLGQSQYSYFLIKPTHVYEEMFGLTRELIVIFSAYDRFEARTLDAYEAIYKMFSGARIERICYALISADEKWNQTFNPVYQVKKCKLLYHLHMIVFTQIMQIIIF